MPHSEKQKQGGSRSEDPLPRSIRFNITGRSFDLTTLKFDKRIKLEICGDEVEELTGRLSNYADIIISNCPKLRTISELSACVGNVVFDNCPELKSCDKVTARDKIILENSGVVTIPESWSFGTILVLKDNPLLEKVNLCEGGDEVCVYGSPMLQSVAGDTRKAFTFNDCPSLQEITPPISAGCITGLTNEELDRVLNNKVLLRKTGRIPDLDWDGIQAKNGTLNWNKKDEPSPVSPEKKHSMLRKLLIFLGVIDRPSKSVVSHHMGTRIQPNRLEKQNF